MPATIALGRRGCPRCPPCEAIPKVCTIWPATPLTITFASTTPELDGEVRVVSFHGFVNTPAACMPGGFFHYWHSGISAIGVSEPIQLACTFCAPAVNNYYLYLHCNEPEGTPAFDGILWLVQQGPADCGDFGSSTGLTCAVAPLTCACVKMYVDSSDPDPFVAHTDTFADPCGGTVSLLIEG